MQVTSSLSEAQRGRAVALFEQGYGETATARRLGVRRDPVKALRRRWLTFGRAALVEKRTKAVYPFEVKLEAVKRREAGQTKASVVDELGLSSDRLLMRWCRQYREGGEDALRAKPKGRPKGSPRPEPLSAEDKLLRRVAKLEAENAYLKALRALKDDPHA